MVHVIKDENCGNAPKQKAVLDFLVAVANMDVEAALSMVADDINLELIGRSSFEGKKAVEELLLKDGRNSVITNMEVLNIISHGKICAANGVWHFDDGSKVAFNNMYVFESHAKDAKIEAIQTYSLMIAKDS